MKIRSFALIKGIAFFLAWLVRLWVGTVRYYYRPRGRSLQPNDLPPGERVIYTFWHGTLALPAYLHGRRDIHVLISEHADGELISETVRHLRFSSVRGSTTRNGLKAIREMMRLSDNGQHLVVTPDGPRGPRRKVKPGVIYLASRTGLPIVLVGWAFSHAWYMRSWDRFAVPYPGCAGYGVTGDPIYVPPNIKGEELERYRVLVEQTLTDLQAEAEWHAQQPWRDRNSRTHIHEPVAEQDVSRAA